ncbi:uncharacterized protein UTRI_10192 [Ustilago trichophora]|uniref:Secreted protein n=1 Tax=Ustilago trichophora TaxID=86804 RepID=A0A5C3EBY0_9BASI|nr:uncharacterized protein UTRI_10192 [Ustilago trichophora]
MLLLAYLRLGILAFTAVSLSLAADRMDSHHLYIHGRPRQVVTYDELSRGSFHPDTGLHPLTLGDGLLLYQAHKTRVFHKGIPIHFRHSDRGYNLDKLQRGFADFGEIHLLEDPKDPSKTLTISKDANEQVVTRQAERAVHDHAVQIRTVQQKYGDLAAITAYGFKFDPVPKKKWLLFTKTRPVPEWEDVRNAVPVPRDMPIEDARARIDAQRFLKFSASDDGSAFGIRLLKDGTQQVQHFASELAVFLPH